MHHKLLDYPIFGKSFPINYMNNFVQVFNFPKHTPQILRIATFYKPKDVHSKHTTGVKLVSKILNLPRAIRLSHNLLTFEFNFAWVKKVPLLV